MTGRAGSWSLAIVVAVACGCVHRGIDADTRARVHRLQSVTPPPGNNWPLPPETVERLFAQEPMELVDVKRTPQGVAGASKGDVVFPRDGRRLQVKWKQAPHGDADGWNNDPRKELATYVVQKWFLAPDDYVVPTVALRCVPLDAYRRLDSRAGPTIAGTRCVLGALSLWLQHVTVPHPVYDPERFLSDPAYAYHFSDFNVLTYLVDHRDGRPGNILAADDDANRRVFAVDNGIAFGGLVYNFLTTNWNVIRVPAVRREVVERLRAVDREALASLATLVELRADAEGVLRLVPPGPPENPDRGARVGPGHLQLGLTAREIDALRRRIASLLERVDRGEIAVF
jgi:hypothetical protein